MTQRQIALGIASLVGLLPVLVSEADSWAQGVQCDPTKVMTAEACAQCHSNEVQVWKQTPHFWTFEQLARSPRASEICRNLGLKSVKRSAVCIQCHFTIQEVEGKTKPVSGISCESCHGASRDWLTKHNDYGGPTATQEHQTESQRTARLQACEALGMRNTQNLYSIACSCLDCHTVPNEQLVNVGHHVAGTSDFELVSWSQGMLRHNFLRGEGKVNVESTPDRLRLMYLIGIIADLEYSTRATAVATSQSTYGFTVAQRAADKATRLYELNQELNDPYVNQILAIFAQAQLKINNESQLVQIANQIQSLGQTIATQSDGANWAAIDAYLPSPAEYKWQSSR